MIQLVRYSGAGNTFLFLDNLKGQHNLPWQKITPVVCNLPGNPPTDGFVVIEKSSQFDFKWNFFNADGSVAEMCGNAARCAVAYMETVLKKPAAEIRFETIAGVIAGRRLSESLYQVDVPLKATRAVEKTVEGVRGYFINTGVPHFVVFQKRDLALGKTLRTSPAFRPSGSNVTFVDTEGVVTFERGVEGFTLACGTGAIAAAICLKEKNKNSIQNIKMPGGELSVDLHWENMAKLTGPVEKQFTITWSESP